MAMKFAFIDNSAAIGDRERKQIRSHVMLGKNLGRKLPSRSRKKERATAVDRPGSEPSARDGNPDPHNNNNNNNNNNESSSSSTSSTHGAAHEDSDSPASSGRRSAVSSSGISFAEEVESESQGQSRRAVTPITPESESTSAALASADASSGSRAASPFSLFAGTEFAYFIARHTQLTPSARDLLYQFFTGIHDALYPPQICRPAPNDTPLWLRYLAINKAFLHATLGISATYLTILRGEHAEASLEASWHFAHALRLVNRYLSQSLSPTRSVPGPGDPASSSHAASPLAAPPHPDSTLAVIISLSIHANITGSVGTGRIHLDGLQRLLNLRMKGGLAALYGVNLPLAQKICRTDLEYSLVEGVPTHFGPSMAEVLARTRPETILGDGERRSSSSSSGDQGLAFSSVPAPLGDRSWWCVPPALFYRLSPALRNVTRDVRALCRALASPERPEALRYQSSLITICYSLLDIAPLGSPDRPTDPIDDAWQLGLIAFMTTIMYNMGRWRIVNLSLLLRVMRERLLSGIKAEKRDRNDEEGGDRDRDEKEARWLVPLRFWLVSFYGYSVLEAEGFDGRWLFPQIRSLAAQLGVCTWTDARAQLTRFPWIAAIHDMLGKRLWDMAMPSAEEMMMPTTTTTTTTTMTTAGDIAAAAIAGREEAVVYFALSP